MDFISSVVTRGGNSSLGSGFDLIVNKDSKYLVIRFRHPPQAADSPPPPPPQGVGGAYLIMVKDINIAL